MNTKPEGQMLTGPRAVDDEAIGVLDLSGSRLPEIYHIATFSPLRVVTQFEFAV
jgi:hypothetical protein